MQREQQALVAQQRDQDALVMSISQPLGFDRGRPVAAVLIFRCGLIFFLHSTVLCFALIGWSERSQVKSNSRLNVFDLHCCAPTVV
jgi:hypothetical protein